MLNTSSLFFVYNLDRARLTSKSVIKSEFSRISFIHSSIYSEKLV